MFDINAQNWTRDDGYTISTDRRYLNVETIFNFLSKESYWNQGIPMELVRKTIDHSTLCFGVYEGNLSSGNLKQVGFGIAVDDPNCVTNEN